MITYVNARQNNVELEAASGALIRNDCVLKPKASMRDLIAVCRQYFYVIITDMCPENFDLYVNPYNSADKITWRNVGRGLYLFTSRKFTKC